MNCDCSQLKCICEHVAARALANEYGRKSMERYGVISQLLQTNSAIEILETLAEVLWDDSEKATSEVIYDAVNELKLTAAMKEGE